MENCRKVYINCMIFSRVSNSFSSTLKQALDIPRCKALSAPLFYEIGYQAIIFLCMDILFKYFHSLFHSGAKTNTLKSRGKKNNSNSGKETRPCILPTVYSVTQFPAALM